MAIEITDANYKELMADTSKPVVIDFWATWCGPCRMVGPVIEELAKEYEGKVVIGKCNVDDNEDLTTEFGIRNIPTILFFKNGEVVDKLIGAQSKEKFVEKFEALL
jgi:thioredoxin 1